MKLVGVASNMEGKESNKVARMKEASTETKTDDDYTPGALFFYKIKLRVFCCFRMLVYSLGGFDFFSTTFFPLIFHSVVLYASRHRVYRGNDAASIVSLNINLQLKLLF